MRCPENHECNGGCLLGGGDGTRLRQRGFILTWGALRWLVQWGNQGLDCCVHSLLLFYLFIPFYIAPKLLLLLSERMLGWSRERRKGIQYLSRYLGMIVDLNICSVRNPPILKLNVIPVYWKSFKLSVGGYNFLSWGLHLWIGSILKHLRHHHGSSLRSWWCIIPLGHIKCLVNLVKAESGYNNSLGTWVW